MKIDEVLALFENGVNPVEVGRCVAETIQLTFVEPDRKTAARLNQQMYDQFPPGSPSEDSIIRQIHIAHVTGKLTSDQYTGLLHRGMVERESEHS